MQVFNKDHYKEVQDAKFQENVGATVLLIIKQSDKFDKLCSKINLFSYIK